MTILKILRHSIFGALCVVMGWWAAGCGSPPAPTRSPLLLLVGGTMRPVMEEMVRLYEKETGQAFEIDYADSGQLLIKIENTRRGDLYVCHDPFGDQLMKKGLGRECWTVATLTPVIAVQKGNPKKIQGPADLAREGIRLGLTDDVYSTLGQITPIMFDKLGRRKEIEKNIAMRARMGGEIANAVGLGSLDAAIVWNAVAHIRRDKLDAVAIPSEFLPAPGTLVTTEALGAVDVGRVKVTLATLKCSAQPEAARAFAKYAVSGRGRELFAKHGFSPAPAEGKEQSLLLYCGAGIRPPIDEAVQAFRAETGVNIVCDYAGSGVLVSRLRLSKKGDLFIPGDEWYVDLAEKEGLIEGRTNVCFFLHAILVKKGNPKKIQTLADLARPGLRLGLGNPDACAIGRTTEVLLTKNKVDLAAVKANLAFSALTVNELGVQMEAGALDAAIVWDAIAAYYKDCADKVTIPLEQNVVSPVPIAILKFSQNKSLAQKFADFLAGEKGRAIFAKHQYTVSLPGK